MTLMRLALLMTFSTLAAPVPAQEHGALLGTLRDSETARPIVGARVQIRSLDTDHEYTTRTDARGRLAYLGLAHGNYLATITQPGYAPIDIFDLVINRSETTRLTLKMTRANRAPFKRQIIRYRQPLINTEDAAIRTVYRTGGQ